MKLGRIALLLVLLAALGAYLWLYEMPAARKEAEKTKLVAVKPDDVTLVDLVFPDREIVLKKTDGVWRLTKPVDAPADDDAVKSMLVALAGIDVSKTIDEPPADLAPFGLDKPDPTVVLTTDAGAQPPIHVGKNATIGGKTYVRRGDEKTILLVPSTLKFTVSKQPKDLRDKVVLNFRDEDVQQVEIKPQGGQTVSLIRKDKEAWTVQPGDLVADPTEARSYLSSLRSARALDFPAADDPTKLGLTSPRLTVTITTGTGNDAKQQSLLLGNDATEGSQKWVYAQRGGEPTVYALGDWIVRTLTRTTGQLRDKIVLGFDPDVLGRIVLERKEGQGATLVRADGKWKVEGSDQPPKEEAITRFIDDLRDLRGSDVAAEPATNLKAFGLDTPDIRITISDKDGKPLGTALLARHDGKYYAMREGAKAAFEARDYMYTRLDKRAGDLAGPPTPTTTMAPGGGDDQPLMGGEDLEEDPGDAE